MATIIRTEFTVVSAGEAGPPGPAGGALSYADGFVQFDDFLTQHFLGATSSILTDAVVWSVGLSGLMNLNSNPSLSSYGDAQHVFGALHFSIAAGSLGSVELSNDQGSAFGRYDMDLVIRLGLMDQVPGDAKWTAFFFGLCGNPIATIGGDPGTNGVWVRSYPMLDEVKLVGRDDTTAIASVAESISAVSNTLRYYKIELRDAWATATLFGSQDGVTWTELAEVTAVTGDFFSQGEQLQIAMLNNTGNQSATIEAVVDLVHLSVAVARTA